MSRVDLATEDGIENIIMQLRKSVTLNGQKNVKFHDGSYRTVSPNVATKALNHFQSLRTPSEKLAFQDKLQHSLTSFNDTVITL